MSNLNQDPEFQRLQALLPILLERSLSGDEREELNSILESSETYRKHYLEYIEIHTLLDDYWGAAAPLGLTEKQVNRVTAKNSSNTSIPIPPAARTGSQSSLLSAFNLNSALLASCLVLLGFNLLAILFSPKQEQLELPRQPLIARPASYAPKLVAATACVWQGEKLPPALGRSFKFGDRLDLVEGIAEFQVQNRAGEKANIRIEGPARIFVRADGQIELLNGILIADTDSEEAPFRVDLPNGSITLTGQTSVGIHSNDRISELHVFEGSAKLEQTWNVGEANSILNLEKGEAVIVEASENGAIVERTEASIRLFASKRSMHFDRLIAGARFENLIREAKPDIYWKFEGNSIVNNEVANDNSGLLVGEVSWRKFNENISPEFGLSTNGGHFVSDTLWPAEPLDSYTVEMWLKPSHYHNGAILSLCSPESLNNGRQKHALLLEIGGHNTHYQPATRPNRYRFLHRSPPAFDSEHGTSCYSESEYEVRQWQHVVARKDGEQLSLFINGKFSSSGVDDSPLPANLKLIVGQLYSQKSERPFVGQIDEVSVYSRALSDQEILNHFQASHQNTASK